MKICQIVPRMDWGGVETGTVDISAELVRRGHQVFVVSSGGRLVPDLERAGVQHVPFPVHDKNPWTIWRTARELSQWVRQEGMDILHARSRVPGWIAFLTYLRTGVPWVTTCHGHYRLSVTGRVMGWAKRVIVASEAIARHMVEGFEVPVEKIVMIPRGIDIRRFPYRPPRRVEPRVGFRVGLVGRMSAIKGHAYFLKAIAQVASRYPRVEAQIIGADPASTQPYVRELKRLARRLGIASQVQWIAPQQDIAAVMSGLDMLVLPTVTPEAFGRVIVEAQACGVPVVATRVGGIVDIIAEGQTGLLVDPRDAQGLAKAIVQMVQEPGLAQRLALAARQRVEERYQLGPMVDRTVAVYETAARERRILVLKFGSLGDLILLIPSLRAIRRQFPEAHITLLVEPQYRAMLRGCPYVNAILRYDRQHRDHSLRRSWELIRLLREQSFDASIDFQNNLRSHLIAFFSCIPKRYGFNRHWTGRLVNHAVEDRKGMAPLDHQALILQALGITSWDRRLELWTTPQDDQTALSILSSYWSSPDQMIIGIHPGGSPRWQTKRYPLAQFAQVINRLAAKRMARIVVTGTASERGLVRQLEKLTALRLIDATGKTNLNELAALIRRCRVFITGDTAALHVAASVGTPTVALFGPTDPTRHAPPSDRLTILQNKQLPCVPCYRTRCRWKVKLACLKSITPEEVVDAASQWLETHANTFTHVSV